MLIAMIFFSDVFLRYLQISVPYLMVTQGWRDVHDRGGTWAEGHLWPQRGVHSTVHGGQDEAGIGPNHNGHQRTSLEDSDRVWKFEFFWGFHDLTDRNVWIPNGALRFLAAEARRPRWLLRSIAVDLVSCWHCGGQYLTSTSLRMMTRSGKDMERLEDGKITYHWVIKGWGNSPMHRQIQMIFLINYSI